MGARGHSLVSAAECFDPYALEFAEGLSVQGVAPAKMDYTLDWANQMATGVTFAGTPVVNVDGAVLESVDVVDNTQIRAWLQATPTAVVGATITIDYVITDSDGRVFYPVRTLPYVP